MDSMRASRPFPVFGYLYSMGSTGSSRWFVASIGLPGAIPALADSRGDQAAIGATARWAMGSAKPGDVVWTRLVGLVLVSARLVTLFRGADCSGWTVYPVRLTGKKGELFADYFGLVVQGRCGPLDSGRSR